MNQTTSHFDVIIIGAGAAGLMCAAQAGKRGRRVLILEKSKKAGKKILMSGGGKCNFTNLYVEPDNYISHNPYFAISALSRYTQWDFLQLIHDYQIEYEERKHGQLFTCHGSKDILNMLLNECQDSQNVSFYYSIEIQKISATSNHHTFNHTQDTLFRIETQLGTFSAPSLVVASGGLSIPTLGGSGIGYEIAKQFGHHVYPTRAGLVPFVFTDKVKPYFSAISGNSLAVILSNDKIEFMENILFTHRGLSGPCALQFSNYWEKGDSFYINFLPQIDSLVDWLLDHKYRHRNSFLRRLLADFFSKKIVLMLQDLIWQPYSYVPIGQITDSALKDIAYQLQNFQVKPSCTEGYRNAEVTLGGVDCDEVSSKTMQSKKQAGLYFIGEVLDVTGQLGGFNFQWAWSSGYVAGQFV